MCIAILNTPKGGLIPKATLKACWTTNRHGAGFAVPMGGKLEIVKELTDFDRFYAKYKAVREAIPNKNIIIHFRISTHGKINLANCHPFLVHEKLAFVHNGICDGFDDAAREKSDTVLFMERVLRNMPKNFIDYEGNRRLIRKSTGWSKFIFLKSTGEARIINEEGGTWDAGNWFSNETYKTTGVYDRGGRTYYSSDFGTQRTIGFTVPDKKVEEITTITDIEAEFFNVKHYGRKKLKTWLKKHQWHIAQLRNNSKSVSVTRYEPSGDPKETRDAEKEYWDEQASVAKAASENWHEVEGVDFNYNTTETDDIPFTDDLDRKVQYCTECYQNIATPIELHYRCCEKCLRELEMIPDDKSSKP